jgi:photosystem II stability/assembly factor-like uncharacterized protein
MKFDQSASCKFFGFAICLAVLLGFSSVAQAQRIDPKTYVGMLWRSIGPFRGGRALAVAGITSEPTGFYFGSVDGGVWKTENAGLTWQPLFQHEPVASIGAIAIAPSDPNVIYVGTGEADMRSDISLGDGMYKSTDGGLTWTHLGLTDTRHIGRILVDPQDPDLVLVAALGHAYDANSDRGVFRSSDGGLTWQKVLYKNELTGAIDLAFAQGNPRAVYAALWQTERPPWSQYPPNGGPGGGIYESTDEGLTWHELTGHGLPSGDLGRIGLATGRGDRVYALIDCKQGGLYRSDDGGRFWQHVSSDPRIWSRGWYFSGVTVDPGNRDIVWVPNVALYRSDNGGRDFSAIKGAPGGDDYHVLWIDSDNTRHMILGSDQGAVVSLDGGQTWSSWYNQPTGQFYHVATDLRVPYWIYGAQQDSGTVGIASRSDYGALTFRDWHPVGGGESGYIVPDPLSPAIIYGGDTYGTLHRYDGLTTQSATISPALVVPFDADIANRKYRFTWTSPLAFSPENPHLLYYGSQYLLATSDGGSSWHERSPDLTAPSGTTGEQRRGVIYTIAPSALRIGEIWVGTDNGLIQLTLDGGKTWKNVTPAGLAAWSKISLIEASHFDPSKAFAAVDRHRLGDIRPYIYVTDDYGQHWREITNGIAESAYVHAVREDPVRRGLLFAGTETGVCVSFDDGAHWQSLQLNLPTTSVRDLAIRQSDLIAATHGRGFWILDDISPLRQLSPQMGASPFHLFLPRLTYRFRRSTNTDDPLPPEEPQGENPPYGAIVYYWLGSVPTGPVTLEVLDATGKLVRHYLSAAKTAPPDMNRFPVAPYWAKPPEALGAQPGMHRLVWDLHYAKPDAVAPDFPIAAVPHETPLGPRGPLAAPGRYTVRLTVDGRSQTQSFELRIDPRVKTTQAALEAQLELGLKVTAAMDQSGGTLTAVRALKERLDAIRSRADNDSAASGMIEALEARLDGLAEGDGGLRQTNMQLGILLDAIEAADVAPTITAQQAWTTANQALQRAMATWRQIRTTDIAMLNRKFEQTRLGPIGK